MLFNENKGNNNGDNSINKTNNPPATLSLMKNKGFWISVFLIQVSFGAYYNFFTISSIPFGNNLLSS